MCSVCGACVICTTPAFRRSGYVTTRKASQHLSAPSDPTQGRRGVSDGRSSAQVIKVLNDPSRARAALLLSWRSLLVLVYVACLLPMALLCLPMTLITRSVAHLKVASPPSFLLLLIPYLPHPPPLPRPASPSPPLCFESTVQKLLVRRLGRRSSLPP